MRELLKLQERDRRGDGLKKNLISQPLTADALPLLEVQQALPDPYEDTLTGR